MKRWMFVIVPGLAALQSVLHVVQSPSGMTPATGRVEVTVLGAAADGVVQPLGDATVTIKNVGATPDAGLSARTDDDGRAVFDRVPAGYCLVEANRIGYLRWSYGAPGLGMPGAPVAVAGSGTVEIQLRLPKGAAISGVVTTPSGAPGYRVPVLVLEPRVVDGVKRFVSASRALATGGVVSTFTGQDGGYRLYGLPRGRYIVVARVDTPVEDQPDARQESSVYFPGTMDVAAATPVQLETGQESSGVSFQIVQTPLARVSGTVGPLPQNFPDHIHVSLTPPALDPMAVDVRNGRFTFAGVAPGPYMLWARSVPAPAPPDSDDSMPAWWGRADIDVGPRGVTDLAIAMNPSTSFAGRIAIDSSATAPGVNFGDVAVSLTPVEAVTGASHVLRVRARANAAGEFIVRGVTPGKYMIDATLPARAAGGAYRLSSAVVDGRDLLGLPMDVLQNQPLPAAVLTLSDGAPEVSGVLEDESGRHPVGCAVVLFAADPARWTSPSGWIRTTTPATDGSFRFADVFAGRYWLGAAPGLQLDDASDPAFLGRLATGSVALTLGRGDRHTENLRLTGPAPCGGGPR